MKETKEYLKELPFWQNLTKSEQENVLKFSQIKTYKKGNIIHSQNHECLGLIKVLKGEVRTFMMSDEGREITLYRMQVNDLDVLSASCVVSQITFETQMVADTDVELLVVPAVYLSTLKEKSIVVRAFIYERLSERFSDVMKTIQRILFTRIDSRIAMYLITKSNELNNSIISITHEEIAREINTSREVASRILKQLEEDKAIKLHRGKIEILNKKQLEEYVY